MGICGSQALQYIIYYSVGQDLPGVPITLGNDFASCKFPHPIY